MMKKILALGVVMMLFIVFSGCLTTREEAGGNWNDLVSSYNPSTGQFVGFNNTVIIEDVIVTCKAMSDVKKTKFILKSNDEVPVYIDETQGHSSADSWDKTPWYNVGDNVRFIAHIEEEKPYGQYIAELDPNHPLGYDDI